jgi:protein-S-isoprenylcysteine O-methyltransferase Ste14
MTKSAWRWIGALLFTLLVPGVVTVVLPYWILDRSVAVRPGPWSVAGALLLLLGLGVYLRCLWDFVVVGRGIPAPVDHPKHLVVRGLYRNVRNPMYLGVLTVLLGEVALFRSAALLRYAALWLLVVHVVVRVYEEPNLRSRFGASYEHYCQHVRRWLPGPAYSPATETGGADRAVP